MPRSPPQTNIYMNIPLPLESKPVALESRFLSSSKHCVYMAFLSLLSVSYYLRKDTMLIRCEDCGNRPFNDQGLSTRDGWHPIPSDFFRPRQAMRFWSMLHGHIPRAWTFIFEKYAATNES